MSTHIKLKAAGELQDSGKREVYFEANGVPRVVEVIDKKSQEVLGKTAIREKVRAGRWRQQCVIQQQQGHLTDCVSAVRPACSRWGHFWLGGKCTALDDLPQQTKHTLAHCTCLLACLLVYLQADVGVLGSVGAPMAGTVIEVSVKAGQAVHAGQQLAVLSAMKMETAVCAPIAGVVTQVAVDQNDALDAGDLIVFVDAASPAAPPLATIDADPMAMSSGSDTESRPTTPTQNGGNGAAAAAESAGAPAQAQAQR